MAYRPFTLPWDDSPVDISFVFADDRPAGKHGFLRVEGDRFVFEDGTEGKFWGTCFNSGANFPRHAEAEQVARRLAKFGINLVRTHQMDAEWATPNIFEVNRARPRTTTRSLDAESLDRLDYLVASLKREGIYVYLDLLTYRQFLAGDGVDDPLSLGQAGKPYIYFDRHLIELQKEFNAQLWTHVNPYTGLAYRDDPTIVLTELVNECDLVSQPVVLEPYRSEFARLYRRWQQARGLDTSGQDEIDFAKPTPQMLEFFSMVQAHYYREMVQHLHSLGVRIPIAGTNWTRNLMTRESQGPTDFLDTHWYWNFPFWESTGSHPRPMVRARENGFIQGVFERRLGVPFFVSEWDHAWPDEWRAESPIPYAAVAALQGWSGMAIHTYRYASYGPVDSLGGGASTINGVTYRNHFDAFNDPAKFGLFHHAALILRRGDVRRADKTAVVTVPSEADDWRGWTPSDLPSLALLAEEHLCGVALPGEPYEAALVLVPNADSRRHEGETVVVSDTGELRRDWQAGFGTVDTARTKAAYGFLGNRSLIELDGLTLSVTSDFAVIALSSLSDDPLKVSRDILLSAVGRCDNTDTEYEVERGLQVSRGHGPVLIEVIEAHVSLETLHPDLKVWLISERGEAVICLPAEYRDGWLSFSIGSQPEHSPSSMYYLIRG